MPPNPKPQKIIPEDEPLAPSLLSGAKMRRILSVKRAASAMSRYKIEQAENAQPPAPQLSNVNSALAAKRAARLIAVGARTRNAERKTPESTFSDAAVATRSDDVARPAGARDRWNKASSGLFATHRWRSQPRGIRTSNGSNEKQTNAAPVPVPAAAPPAPPPPAAPAPAPAPASAPAAEIQTPTALPIAVPVADFSHHESLPMPFEDDDEDSSIGVAAFSSQLNSMERVQRAHAADWKRLQSENDMGFVSFSNSSGIRNRKRISRSGSQDGGGNQDATDSKKFDAEAAFEYEEEGDAVVTFAVRSPNDEAAAAKAQLRSLSSQMRSLVKHMEGMREQQTLLRRAVGKRSREARDLQEELEDEKERFHDLEARWERSKEAEAMMRARHGMGLTLDLQGHGSAKMQAEAEARRKKVDERRRMLLEAGAEEAEEEAGFDDNLAGAGAHLLKRLQRRLAHFARRHIPLKSDLRTVQARYGASVCSYFKFTRWILLNYLIVAAVAAVSYGYHLSELYQREKTKAAATSTGSGLLPLSSFLNTQATTFTGQIPYSWQYSSFDADEALHYTCLSVGLQLTFLGRTLYKWITEDKTSKENEVVEAVSAQAKYARLCLNAWDCSLKRPSEARDLKFAIGSTINVTLHEEQVALRSVERSRCQRFTLFLRRCAGFLLYLVLQCSCWGAIMYLTAQSATLADMLKRSYPQLAGLSASVVPAAVSVINAMLPPLIKVIVALERWDSAGTVAKQMTSRLYFAKIFNAMIQVFSFGLLIDPVLFTEKHPLFPSTASSSSTTTATTGSSAGSGLSSITFASIRAAAQKGFDESAYTCRSEAAAAGFFNLVLTEFVVGKVLAGAVPLLQRNALRAAGKPFVKSEFDVAQQMVNLFYFQLLSFMAFPLAPYSVIVISFFWVVNFKWEKLILLQFKSKPHQPWSAKNAGSFFIKFYFITLAIGVGGNFYFLSTPSLPKSCTIQDAFVGLCAETAGGRSGSSTYNATTQTCTLNVNASSYDFFSDTATCDGGYPKCICSGNSTQLACGPFTLAKYGFTPMLAYFSDTDGVSIVYSLLTNNIAFVWALVMWLVLRSSMLGNSLRVIADVNVEKESMWKAMIENSERKVRKLTKKVGLLEKVAVKSTGSKGTESEDAADS